MNAAGPTSRGFWPEVMLGLALSLGSAAVFHVLRPLLGSADALRLILLGCTGAYLLWTLRGSETRVGRVVSLCGFVALTIVLLAWNPGLWAWLGSLTGVAWLLRSLYRHDSLVAVAADAGLALLALAVGLWSLHYSHSLWLALWCFFLTQALHHAIPRGWGARPAPQAAPSPADEAFEQARRASEAAFSRLARR